MANSVNLIPHDYIKQEETFLSMSILSSEYSIGNYFPLNSSSVEINHTMNWNILLSNVGISKYAKIKIKLINDSQQLPDQIKCMPSDTKSLVELRVMLPKNGNRTIPVEWKILKYDQNKIMIILNDQKIEHKIQINQGDELTLLFELWVYDAEVNNFKFKWYSRTKYQCIWNRISFIIF